MSAPASLRELRLWHWRLVMSNRTKARLLEEDGTHWDKRHARVFHRKADWHLSAVQVLNDVVSGTAEDDDQKVVRNLTK